RKEVTIISKKTDDVVNFIMHSLKRGATVHQAIGAYTRQSEDVITTVLNRKQAMELRNFIHITDPHAFITIVDSSETIGKGFRDA
ncbi:MAG: YitT family protein, partial [Ruthenibacterium sp.]